MKHADKASVLQQGIIIFVFLAVLTALEFLIAVAIEAIALLAVIAIMKVGLVMYYYMHIYKLSQDAGEDRHSVAYKTATSRLGLWLFLLSDAFVFGGLAVARFNLLGFTRPHLNQVLGLAVTSVLLLSSFFMNRAEASMAHGDRKGFGIGIVVTLMLGIAFVAGVLGIEWPTAIAEGVSPSASAGGAVFFMMTGMHALHVITGLILLGIVWRNGSRGLYSADRHWAVEATAVYWHFVDVVWIFFYPALYLVGRVA